jgi:hypothetical protein
MIGRGDWQMRTLATLCAASAMLLCISGRTSLARYEGPWCLHVTMGFGGGIISYCDMRSYEMCRAEMRAMGGSYCTQNPYYWWNRPEGPAARKSRRQAN